MQLAEVSQLAFDAITRTDGTAPSMRSDEMSFSTAADGTRVPSGAECVPGSPHDLQARKPGAPSSRISLVQLSGRDARPELHNAGGKRQDDGVGTTLVPPSSCADATRGQRFHHCTLL